MDNEDELVQTKDLEITVGEEKDLASDFENITYDGEKVRVSFYRASSEDGKEFDANKAAWHYSKVPEPEESLRIRQI